MNNIMSIIFAQDNETKLNELTIHRTTASMPFAGRYRLIDFALSNLVNSDITRIGIITRSNYSSLMDHIRMGRDWDLNRKNSGIAVFPPYVLNTSRDVYRGKVEALHSIMHFIMKAKEDYVIISNSNVAASIDFDDVYNYHVNNGADITVVCSKGITTSSRRIVVDTDEDGRLTDLSISEAMSTSPKTIGLNIYLIKKDLLGELIENAYARGLIDFEKEVLMKNISNLKIMSYKLQGHAAIIDDIKTYYRESMNLLREDIRKDLFYKFGTIFTKVKDSVPTMYRENAVIKNSLIADGCDINGTVENSILFRGVKIEEGAVVKNSIVMESGKIMKNAELSYAITDKNVTIGEGRKLAGFDTYPIVFAKNKVV